MIVPGKRSRNYEVIRNITENDQVVKISKTTCPDYVSKEEWENLPDAIVLRRITYTYPTKNGLESAILFTTIVDDKITATEIVTKYTMRWDIEISIIFAISRALAAIIFDKWTEVCMPCP